MGAECEERPPQVGYSRSGNEMGGLDLEERNETEDEATYLSHWPNCFSVTLGLRVPRKRLLEVGGGVTEGAMRKVGGEDMYE